MEGKLGDGGLVEKSHKHGKTSHVMCLFFKLVRQNL